MKELLYILILLGLFQSCKQNTELKKGETQPNEHQIWLMEHDTILEKNSPRSLDLSKHQLFIDTTRNSQFYKRVMNPEPTEMNNSAMEYYINEISKKHKIKKIDLKNFPKHWITLRKLNSRFIIYEPCNGQTPSYLINESSVYFMHQIEPDADLINKLIRMTNDEIELELSTIPQKTKSEKAILTIKPSQFKYVYELTYSFDEVSIKQFVTPNNKVPEFDIIVNHCPKALRMEYKGFDELK